MVFTLETQLGKPTSNGYFIRLGKLLLWRTNIRYFIRLGKLLLCFFLSLAISHVAHGQPSSFSYTSSPKLSILLQLLFPLFSFLPFLSISLSCDCLFYQTSLGIPTIWGHSFHPFEAFGKLIVDCKLCKSFIPKFGWRVNIMDPFKIKQCALHII